MATLSFLPIPLLQRIGLAVVVALSLLIASLAAQAQQKAMPVIGVLGTGWPSASSGPFLSAAPFRSARVDCGDHEDMS